MVTFYNQNVDKKTTKKILSWFLENYGPSRTIEFLEELKGVGFHFATLAGLSLGFDDLLIPNRKQTLIKEAEQASYRSEQKFIQGRSTAVERYNSILDIWTTASETLKDEVISNFRSTDLFNPLYMMAFSGARGNISQVRQLVGMRGLMSDSAGGIIDFPIRKNFREGLTVTEYVISCYGARKGLIDTALRTADSGYLTRRLVDVAHGIMIGSLECGTSESIEASPLKSPESGAILLSIEKRIIGRVLAETNEPISAQFANELIHRNDRMPGYLTARSWLRSKRSGGRNQSSNPASKQVLKQTTTPGSFSKQLVPIEALPKPLLIRSPLTCKKFQNEDICQLCYGWSLAHGRLVSLGEAVGVLAAQSIGEPGTQLTMRTFHTGGIFSTSIDAKIFAPHNGYIFFAHFNRSGVSNRGEIGLLDGPDGLSKQPGTGGIRSIAKRSPSEYQTGAGSGASSAPHPNLQGFKIRTFFGETAFFSFESSQLILIEAIDEQLGASGGTDFADALSSGGCGLPPGRGEVSLLEDKAEAPSNQPPVPARSFGIERIGEAKPSPNQPPLGAGTGAQLATGDFGPKVSFLSLPPQSLIFVYPGQKILKNTLCAETTSLVQAKTKKGPLDSRFAIPNSSIGIERSSNPNPILDPPPIDETAETSYITKKVLSEIEGQVFFYRLTEQKAKNQRHGGLSASSEGTQPATPPEPDLEHRTAEQVGCFPHVSGNSMYPETREAQSKTKTSSRTNKGIGSLWILHGRVSSLRDARLRMQSSQPPVRLPGYSPDGLELNGLGLLRNSKPSPNQPAARRGQRAGIRNTDRAGNQAKIIDQLSGKAVRSINGKSGLVVDCVSSPAGYKVTSVVDAGLLGSSINQPPVPSCAPLARANDRAGTRGHPAPNPNVSSGITIAGIQNGDLLISRHTELRRSLLRTASAGGCQLRAAGAGKPSRPGDWASNSEYSVPNKPPDGLFGMERIGEATPSPNQQVTNQQRIRSNGTGGNNSKLPKTSNKTSGHLTKNNWFNQQKAQELAKPIENTKFRKPIYRLNQNPLIDKSMAGWKGPLAARQPQRRSPYPVGDVKQPPEFAKPEIRESGYSISLLYSEAKPDPIQSSIQCRRNDWFLRLLGGNSSKERDAAGSFGIPARSRRQQRLRSNGVSIASSGYGIGLARSARVSKIFDRWNATRLAGLTGWNGLAKPNRLAETSLEAPFHCGPLRNTSEQIEKKSNRHKKSSVFVDFIHLRQWKIPSRVCFESKGVQRDFRCEATSDQALVPGFFESSEGTGGCEANDDSKKQGRWTTSRQGTGQSRREAVPASKIGEFIRFDRMGQIIIRKYVSELSVEWITSILQVGSSKCSEGTGGIQPVGMAEPNQTSGPIEIICRKVHPYLISNNSTLTVQHGDAVLQRQILFELIFEKSKTGDIVQGLPKIEQLFEARRTSPHVLATIHGQLKSKYFGLLEDTGFLIPGSRFVNDPGFFESSEGIGGSQSWRANWLGLAKDRVPTVPSCAPDCDANARANDRIGSNGNNGLTKTNRLTIQTEPDTAGSFGMKRFASPNQHESRGQQLQMGAPLRELKAAKIALRFIQKILVDEIQFVYSSQGVEISDKHIEIIVRQMTSKVIISEKGNTSFYPDDIIEFQDIENFVLSKISQAVPGFFESSEGTGGSAPDCEIGFSESSNRANHRAQASRNLIADWRHRESDSGFEDLTELSTPCPTNHTEPANIGFNKSSQDEALKPKNYYLHPSTGHPGNKYPLDGESLIEGLRFEPIVLGITKRAFLSESWASSASFQEAKKVLMEAALQSKVDFLFGLKSNLIVGRYIRAGTSFR